MSMSMSPGHNNTQMRPTKVAIPRLPREMENASVARDADKSRVSHACEPCRARKTKCTGEKPRCAHCQDHGLMCQYGDGKRDKAKRELNNLQDKIEEYERLLKQLSLQGDSAVQLAIKKALTRPALDRDDGLKSPSAQGRKRRFTQSEGVGQDAWEGDPAGEERISADIGSAGSLDQISQDFEEDEDAAKAGFFGKASDIAWIHRTQNSLAKGNLDDDDYEPVHVRSGLQSSADESSVRPSYHLDNLENSMPDHVDEFLLPPKEVADKFVDGYFKTVHPSFPILARANFSAYYEQCYDSYARPVSRRRRAMLNLVFAIGAKWSILTNADLCDQGDDLIFFSRARLLSLDKGALWQTGDMEQVQLVGLCVIYLTGGGYTNRAWYVSGLVVRYAQALGLHLRNETKHMPAARKERAIRLWWSVYSLERLLGVMTGRPSATSAHDISTPLPSFENEETLDESSPRSATDHAANGPSINWQLPGQDPRSPEGQGIPPRPFPTPSSGHVSKAQSSSATSQSPTVASPSASPRVTPSPWSYFYYRTQLNIIIEGVAGTLYCADIVKKSWGDAQKQIMSHKDRLEKWHSTLPALFDFRKKHRDQVFVRERLCLGMLYWSTTILIGRPCLCRLDSQIPNESSGSKVFNRKTAALCLHAASEMLRLIPDEPNPTGLYNIAPWWATLHHLTQAASVFMLELGFRARHVPGEAQKVLSEAKKAVNWLRAMAENSDAADLAWKLLDGLLRQVAPKIGGDTSDMPRESPRSNDSPEKMDVGLEPEAFHDWRRSPENQEMVRSFGQYFGFPFSFDTLPDMSLVPHFLGPDQPHPYDVQAGPDMIYPEMSQPQQFSGAVVPLLPPVSAALFPAPLQMEQAGADGPQQALWGQYPDVYDSQSRFQQ